MNKDSALFIIYMIIGHIFVWFQTNAQLKWTWFRENTFLLVLLGIPLSYLYIMSTRYGYQGFEKLWTVRLVGFAIGIIIFAIMTAIVMKEVPDMKTFVSLALCVLVLLVQIFL